MMFVDGAGITQTTQQRGCCSTMYQNISFEPAPELLSDVRLFQRVQRVWYWQLIYHSSFYCTQFCRQQ